MKRRLRGLILDIDGTLTDSNDIHAAAWKAAFEHFGKALEYALVRSQIGKGGDLLVPDLLNGKEMRKFGKQLTDYRGKIFKKEYMPKIRPFPGIPEAVRSLATRGIKLALASSAEEDEVAYYTDLLGIGDLLEGSTSAADAEFSKPSPEIFEAALKKIGTSPDETATVGDTPYDILASHRAALPIIAVRSGGFDPQLLEKAEFLLDGVIGIEGKLGEIDAYIAE